MGIISEFPNMLEHFSHFHFFIYIYIYDQSCISYILKHIFIYPVCFDILKVYYMAYIVYTQ